MTNSLTRSQTETFTIADAKYLASRITHALTIYRIFYGHLTEQKVQDLAMEAAILLKYNLLDNVKYGYKDKDGWVHAIGFFVDSSGQLSSLDETPSIIDVPASIANASWYSFLTRRNNPNLTYSEILEIDKLLPINRSEATEPSSTYGIWQHDDTYSRSGTSMKRQLFRRY